MRFVLRHPAHFIAFGGGIGLIPFAPGTFGTLLALPIFWLAGPRLDAGRLSRRRSRCSSRSACGRAASPGRALGASRPRRMVWDETVAFLLVLFFTPVDGYWQAFAFLVFRVFDIVKPPPIRYYERMFKGGFGVMIDDIARRVLYADRARAARASR